MALSTHELYLILRARDEASRVLRSFGNEFSNLDRKAQAGARRTMAAGAGLVTVGVAVAAGGLLALSALNNMTNAAMAYNQATSLTLTQVDKAKVSFNDLWKMGLKIGTTVPVAFDDIQKSLYDIFSSISTDGPGAEKILDAIAKAAVGGQTSMQMAGRAIIAVLNAYKMPASAAVKVSDVLFQLVRKGVGTYEQFTEVIGRAIPSALKSGQSIESLAGMMAFLTRNGLTAANAAASAARALDALSKPSAIKNLHEIGVEVQDSSGKFRPMVDIMTDMRNKLKDLTPVARAVKLNEIFKGAGGTIQAMRFFNLGVSDSKGLLAEMTTAMGNAGGAAAEAYNIMSNTPQAKIQLLNNKYQAMKITIGNQLIPVKLRLVEILSKMLSWWERLSPSVQKLIVKIVLISSVAAVLVGIVTAVAGVMLILSGALALVELELMPVLLIVGAVILALIGIGVAVYYVIKYWDTIVKFTKKTWDTVYNAVVGAWNAAYAWTTRTLGSIWAFISQIWNNIAGFTVSVWNRITSAVRTAWSAIVNAVMTALNFVSSVITTVTTAINSVWQAFWRTFGGVVKAWVNFVVAFASLGFHLLLTLLFIFIYPFQLAWRATWSVLRTVTTVAFNAISSFIRGTLGIIRNVFNAVWSNIAANTRVVFSIIRSIIVAVWGFISQFISGVLSNIRSLVSGAWNTIKSITGVAWNGIRIAMIQPIENMLGLVRSIGPRVVSQLGDMGSLLLHAGEALVGGFIHGIENMLGSLANVAKKITSFLPHSPIKSGPLVVLNKADKMLYPHGKALVRGFAKGIESEIGPLNSSMSSMVPGLTTGAVGGAARQGPGNDLGNKSAINQQFTIYTQEIDPRKHAADLGWELATRV